MNKDGRYIRCPECGEKTDIKVYEDTATDFLRYVDMHQSSDIAHGTFCQ